MTDWRLAGQRADVARVQRMIQTRYRSGAKTIVRSEVVAYLRAAGGERPLDLWGGGLSAAEMAAAGMRPLVVEDGSAAVGLGIKAARLRRSFELSCAASGWDARWGLAEAHAWEADCAFLDFCCHWSTGVKRALEACRHHKALAVTLMLGRAPLGQLSTAEWKRVYGVLVSAATGLVLTTTRVYARASGQRAIVFMLRRKRYGIRVPRNRQRDADRQKLQRTLPEVRERINALKRQDYARHREEIRARQAVYHARPEVRERERLRYWRPEVRERARARGRERYARPGVAERLREYQRARRQQAAARKRAQDGPGPYACPDCDRVFGAVRGLALHRRRALVHRRQAVLA